MIFKKKNNPESGVAIWYILAGIALFAALSFSFVRSVSNSQGGTNKEQAKIAANEILRYAKSVEQGVQKLLLINNCSENDISFYSDKWGTPADYDNPNTPFAGGDFTCHVFHPDGAGIAWKLPKGNDGSDYVITGRLKVFDIGTNTGDGTSERELLLLLGNLNLDMCKAINILASDKFDNGIPLQDVDDAPFQIPADYFKGSFIDGKTISSSTPPTLNNVNSACFEGGGTPPPDTYHFYHVLIAR